MYGLIKILEQNWLKKKKKRSKTTTMEVKIDNFSSVSCSDTKYVLCKFWKCSATFATLLIKWYIPFSTN